MTSFDIAAELTELAPKIEGARVENVYQIDPRIMLLRTRPLDLVVEAGRRLHSTRYRMKPPSQPTQFCQALRKYLNNGVVRSINQPEFERIVILMIESRGENYRLTVELFGRGNVILTDADDKILQALEQRRMRDRSVVRGARLTPPPPSGLNPLRISRQDLEPLRSSRDAAVRALARQLGLGGLYAEEVLSQAGIPKDSRCDELTDQQIGAILSAVNDLTSRLAENRLDPLVVVGPEGGWLDALPFRLSVYADMTAKPFSSFDEALDEYFTKQTLARQVEGVRGESEDRVREQERILAQQEEQLSKTSREAVELRDTANSILERVSNLESLLQHIRNQRDAGRDWASIEESLKTGDAEKQPWGSSILGVDPSQRSVSVKLEERAVPLDTRRTAYENAGAYFQRAKEAEERARGIRSAIEQTLNRIRTLKTAHAEKAEPLVELAKRPRREWYQNFRWCFSSEDFLIIGGRDANTNELIVKKHMSPADLVFHSDAQGAPFVLVRTEGRKPSEQTIQEAAELAASYSRAWRENAAAADVYWVNPEQVSPEAPSGEYMTKGMFMIYGPRNYLRGVQLRVAIGVISDEGSPRVIGGPPSAVKSRTSVFVELVPGREQSGKLAKRIKTELIRRSPERDRQTLGRLALEEIQAFIPAGRGEIILR